MSSSNADIIAQLRKDILPLLGFRSTMGNTSLDAGLGPLKYSFPNALFPTGAMHEFLSNGLEGKTATIGFIAGILSSLMQNNGVSVWISPSQTIFPPALKAFGIDPDKIIFIILKKEKDILWTMEEALKCDGLSSVVSELREVNFTASRRFQLAVEQSRVTGFILRCDPKNSNTNACIARWRVASIPGVSYNDLPGLGFPRWNVDLLKIRNGKPGNWQLEWTAGKFRHINKVAAAQLEQRKKTA